MLWPDANGFGDDLGRLLRFMNGHVPGCMLVLVGFRWFLCFCVRFFGWCFGCFLSDLVVFSTLTKSANTIYIGAPKGCCLKV